MSIEYTVCRRDAKYPGFEEAISSGHFPVGKDFGTPDHPFILFKDEPTAYEAAVAYAEQLNLEDTLNRYIVHRIQDDLAWEEK